MLLLINFLGLLMSAGNKAVSFGVYDIKKSLTPAGWAVVFILPLALLFGAVYLAVKIFKKQNLK